jgi:hypothetical protein
MLCRPKLRFGPPEREILDLLSLTLSQSVDFFGSPLDLPTIPEVSGIEITFFSSPSHRLPDIPMLPVRLTLHAWSFWPHR